MKSLSLSRPLVLMLIGLPGSGKSFFARQFSETFGAPLISCDFVRSTLFETPTFSKDEDSLVSELLTGQLDELLKTQKTIIVDGATSSYAERQTVAKSAKKAGYQTLLIWVQTDVSTAEQRSTKRSSRRQGDALNASMSSDIFRQNTKRFNPPTRSEDFVVISGKHTFTTQARVVLKKLVEPRPVTTQTQPVERTASHDDSETRRRKLTIS